MKLWPMIMDPNQALLNPGKNSALSLRIPVIRYACLVEKLNAVIMTMIPLIL